MPTHHGDDTVYIKGEDNVNVALVYCPGLAEFALTRLPASAINYLVHLQQLPVLQLFCF